MNKTTFFSSGGLLFLLTGLSFFVVVSFWVVLVCRSFGRARKCLLRAGLTVIGLSVVLFGGQWGLGTFELAWRQWVKSVLAFLLWCGGWAVCVAIAYWNSGAFRKSSKVFRRCVQMIVGLSILVAMGLGTLFGGAWLYGGRESVVERNGKTVVMTEEHILDYVCIYYEYHGPFVRGSKAIGPIGG